jgi:hypothetical protein
MSEGRKRSTRYQVEQRRMVVSQMTLQGKKLTEIAPIFGVTPQQISLDRQVIRKEWEASALRNFDEALSIELAHLNEIRREAWLAWERSIGKHTVTRNEAGVMVNGKIDKTVTTSEPLSGDPRYFTTLLQVNERISRLLGLDAPVRADLTLGFSLEDLLADATPVDGERIDTPDTQQPQQIEAAPNGNGQN